MHTRCFAILYCAAVFAIGLGVGMKSNSATDPDFPDVASFLASLATTDPAPFALVHRPAPGGGTVELFTGPVTELDTLADIPLPGEAGVDNILAVIPFRQIIERGYVCHDDHRPILALRAERHASIPVARALAELPDLPVCAEPGAFDVPDEEYAAIVRRVLADEIGTGEGSNFVIRRSYRTRLADYRPAVAVSIFRRLLTAETNAYWTFVVHTGDRTFVGASPEQHVAAEAGRVRMNPISGTYRYPAAGAAVPGVLDFLADQKEVDELFMVVDEELKMLADTCARDVRVRGPYLREMARLAHTEYELDGYSTLDVREVLRRTMFAPTIIGSPLRNACRVLAQHEQGGRGYYGGAIALLRASPAGTTALDSAIMIRSAEVDRDGALRVDVGATLVRDSRPDAEVSETWTKVDALLRVIGTGCASTPARSAPLADRPEIGAALARRNTGLSTFWMSGGDATVDASVGRMLIVDADDMFTRMLAHQARSIGRDVTVRSWADIGPRDLDEIAEMDCAVLGPGPGDPRSVADPRIVALRSFIEQLLARRTPLVAECLSHQLLCSVLGLDLTRLPRPNQGTRRQVDLFGERRGVGFYNSFAARHRENWLPEQVELARERDGVVNAVRGPGFASVQFHVESVLTEHGVRILADLMSWAVRAQQPAVLVPSEAR